MCGNWRLYDKTENMEKKMSKRMKKESIKLVNTSTQTINIHNAIKAQTVSREKKKIGKNGSSQQEQKPFMHISKEKKKNMQNAKIIWWQKKKKKKEKKKKKKKIWGEFFFFFLIQKKKFFGQIYWISIYRYF